MSKNIFAMNVNTFLVIFFFFFLPQVDSLSAQFERNKVNFLPEDSFFRKTWKKSFIFICIFF